MKESSEGFIHAACTKHACMCACTTLNDIGETVGDNLQLKMASTQQRAACVYWTAKTKSVNRCSKEVQNDL